jgi:hypothetical protein
MPFGIGKSRHGMKTLLPSRFFQVGGGVPSKLASPELQKAPKPTELTYIEQTRSPEVIVSADAVVVG